jgi:2,5-furandicarboxylate decarboxylase 1
MISAERPAMGVDTERFRLRAFVEALPPDQLERHDEPLSLAAVAAILEGNPRAVLFSNIGGTGESLVGNAIGSRERMARAFGVAPDQLLAEILRR